MINRNATRRKIRALLGLATAVYFLAGADRAWPQSGSDPLPQRLESARRTHNEADLRTVESQFEQCVAQNTRDPASLYQLARVESWLADVFERRKDKKTASAALDKAIEAVQRSLELDEKSSDAHSLLADLYGRKISYGEFTAGPKYGPKVKKEHQRTLELDPKNPRAWASLGRQYFMAPKMFGGDVGKAVESFRKSLELDPQQDETWVWLAKAYQKHDDEAGARDAIQHALQLNPQSGFARDTAASLEK